MINDVGFSDLINEGERLKAGIKKYLKKRFIFDEIKQKQNLIVGVHGLRGTGKSTLLLQLAGEKENSAYVNVEELVFRGISIIEFVELANKNGFENIFIDEIHESPTWANELKILYDRGIKNIFFSGSSGLLLKEKSVDLSRRALLYYLPPFSFREFLEFNFGIEFEKIEFEDVINFNTRKKLIAKIAPYANHFQEYIELGTFPFYLEQKKDAFQLYKRILDRIVRVDLASVSKIDVNYIENVYKILNSLALASPSEASYNSLANSISKNVYVVEEIMRCLWEVGLINRIKPFKKGASIARKEYKFLISPPFRLVLARALGIGKEQVKGGIREDLFIANTRELNPFYVKTDRERKTPDYVINGLNFEIGPHKYKHGTDYYVKEQLLIDERTIPLPVLCMFY